MCVIFSLSTATKVSALGSFGGNFYQRQHRNVGQRSFCRTNERYGFFMPHGVLRKKGFPFVGIVWKKGDES